MSNMQESVYDFMRQAFFDRMQMDGVEVIWLSAENNEAKQRFDFETLLGLDPQVIVFQPLGVERSSELVRKAVDSGVPVIALDRLPGDAPVALFVTADSRKVGELQAQRLVEQLGGSGNVLILQGDEIHSVSVQITEGNLSVLEGFPGIRVVQRKSHRLWDRALARLTVDEALDAFPAVDGILANNSGMAMGAVDALRARGLAGKIPVVGADADFDACRAVLRGEILAEVDKRPYELGEAAYESALGLILGHDLKRGLEIRSGANTVPVRLTPVKLIDSRNLKDEMAYRWGAFAFAD